MSDTKEIPYAEDEFSDGHDLDPTEFGAGEGEKPNGGE